jgi:carbon-monoxide dehydrogenase large subunit
VSPGDDPVPSVEIGQPVPRREDAILVQGQGRYTDDLSVERQLFAAFVRSPMRMAL